MAKVNPNIFAINETQIDREWLRQAQLVYQVGEAQTAARLKMSQAKATLDLELAKLDKMIRTNPEDFQLDKISEKAVEHTILTQASYKKALEHLNQCTYEHGIIQSASFALSDKKTAMEELIRLKGMDMWSNPSAKDDVSKQGLEMIKDEMGVGKKARGVRPRKNKDEDDER